MKVNTYSATSDDCRDRFCVKVDGEVVMSFYDGEPEDNSLGRNFNDIYNLDDLLNKVHEAGKNGESLEIIHKDIEWNSEEDENI